MYLYTLNLKGFIPKRIVPLCEKNLIKYISIEKVLNKNKVLSIWKNVLIVLVSNPVLFLVQGLPSSLLLVF